MSGDELGRLFEALDHPETPATIKDIVLLALTTGARKGNLLSMSWAEIIDFVFHDLRRTAGSWQAHIGSSDIIIGKSLGHSSTQSTRVYARIRDNNPIKESMAGGFAAMKKASQEKKIANIGDKQ